MIQGGRAKREEGEGGSAQQRRASLERSFSWREGGVERGRRRRNGYKLRVRGVLRHPGCAVRSPQGHTGDRNVGWMRGSGDVVEDSRVFVLTQDCMGIPTWP